MIKDLEEKHGQEKKDTQKQFEEYKNRVKERESQVEKDYQLKVNDFKLEVMDIKKKFEQRAEEFRK